MAHVPLYPRANPHAARAVMFSLGTAIVELGVLGLALTALLLILGVI